VVWEGRSCEASPYPDSMVDIRQVEASPQVPSINWRIGSTSKTEYRQLKLRCAFSSSLAQMSPTPKNAHIVGPLCVTGLAFRMQPSRMMGRAFRSLAV